MAPFPSPWRPWWLAGALALASPGVAAQCADDLARKVFEAGHAYYEAGDYTEALRSFKRSYELCPRAEQQLNIGATHERLGAIEEAVEAYERYLATAPADAPNRESIKVRIANLKKRIDVAPTPAPTAPAAASAPPSTAPPPASAPAAPRPPQPRAPHDRSTAAIVLTVSSVIAVGSLATGLVARSRYTEAKRSCAPRCSEGEIDRIKQTQLISTALTGVAALGAGLSLYLFLNSAPEPSRPGLRSVGASLAPGAAGAQAEWAF